VLEVPSLKLSKAAKARIKRMSATDKKAAAKAAILLADAEMISSSRCAAILRTLGSMRL
jgi:hypothetical protein